MPTTRKVLGMQSLRGPWASARTDERRMPGRTSRSEATGPRIARNRASTPSVTAELCESALSLPEAQPPRLPEARKQCNQPILERGCERNRGRQHCLVAMCETCPMTALPPLQEE